MPVILASQEAEIRRKSAQANSSWGPILKKTDHKSKVGRVAQDVGPEFKLQHRKKKKKVCHQRKKKGVFWQHHIWHLCIISIGCSHFTIDPYISGWAKYPEKKVGFVFLVYLHSLVQLSWECCPNVFFFLFLWYWNWTQDLMLWGRHCTIWAMPQSFFTL
jgi:hypothetical protein